MKEFNEHKILDVRITAFVIFVISKTIQASYTVSHKTGWILFLFNLHQKYKLSLVLFYT